MAEIILDYSANTFRNDKTLIKRAIDEIQSFDKGKHKIVFKTQLFKEAGQNIPCTHDSFEYLYDYGNSKGYEVTSSIFDKESLDYLLRFKIPFVKIANRPDLYWLIGEIPRKNAVYVSGNKHLLSHIGLYYDRLLFCISEYPADICKYVQGMPLGYSTDYLSDHTIGLDLYKKYLPNIWEKHLKLSDSTGLDAGPFAITPQELAEIL